MPAANAPLAPPLSYQGGKQRLAGQILDFMDWKPGQPLADLCCGSAAVAIEAVQRGAAPADIRLVESGPWGDVWTRVARGSFDLIRFRWWVDQVPGDLEGIGGYLKELSSQTIDASDVPYVYLLLQAGSFGGKAIWRSRDQRWQNASFRSYWKPTATSSRRSPVNPMMPMPDTLYERTARIVDALHGVQCHWGDVASDAVMEQFLNVSGLVAYLDPPYAGTTRYGDAVNLSAFLARFPTHIPLYVSEGKPLSPSAVILNAGMAKGGISGQRKSAHHEWLSAFHGPLRREAHATK